MIKGKTFLTDNNGQVGGIVMLFLGVFIVGFLYIVLGYMEGFYVTQNNLLISGRQVPYSQDHADSLSDIFAYWWGVPIFAVVYFTIYAIKAGIQSEPGESY